MQRMAEASENQPNTLPQIIHLEATIREYTEFLSEQYEGNVIKHYCKKRLHTYSI